MKAHVLLVDDDRHISQVLRRALVYDGYSVDVVYNGNDALKKTIEDRRDVVIRDIMLPGMGGREICDRLRKSGNQVPILMLTAKDAIEDRVVGLDMGADDYLVKPVELAEFQ